MTNVLVNTHPNFASEGGPFFIKSQSQVHLCACVTVHVTLTQLQHPRGLFTNSVTTQSPWRPNLAETRRRQGAPCHRGNKSGMLPRRPGSGPPLYTMRGRLALSIEDVLIVMREPCPRSHKTVAPYHQQLHLCLI